MLAPILVSRTAKARWPRRLMLLAVAVAGLAGSIYLMQALKSDHQPFLKVSVWYTGAPNADVWTQVDAEYMLEVHSAARTDAIALLHDRNYIALSSEGLALFAPNATPPPGYGPYLIRGLQLSRYQHQPQVFVSPTADVWLRVEAVSRWPLPMLERPLILFLKASPQRVHVDAEVHDRPPDSLSTTTRR